MGFPVSKKFSRDKKKQEKNPFGSFERPLFLAIIIRIGTERNGFLWFDPIRPETITFIHSDRSYLYLDCELERKTELRLLS